MYHWGFQEGAFAALSSPVDSSKCFCGTDIITAATEELVTEKTYVIYLTVIFDGFQ